MRYSDSVIEEVRNRNDIVDVVSGYVRLQKKGSTYFGLCPFHNEKSPSFSVTPSKQMYYCFGCGAGGSVFNFIMEYENCTFGEALKSLAERAGIVLPKQDLSDAMLKEDRQKNRLYEINKLAAVYFFKQLGTPLGKAGYQYLTGRGLSDETIKNFGLGFSPTLPADKGLYGYLRKKGFSDEELKQSALFRFDEKGVFDKFWNRVMFPIMNENSKVVGFGGRVMGKGEPKYLNSQETLIFEKSRTLYGLHVARRSREKYMLICEGYMDVIALHQAGFTNAVAALGTAFTQRHSVLLKRFVSEVVLTFDSDGAGIKAALRAMPILKSAGLSVKVLNLKPYKDPDEFIKNLGREAFLERIKNASNGFMFEVEILKRNFDLSDPDQKTQFQKELAMKFLEFTEEIERNNYMEAVCRVHQIDFDRMKRLVNSLGAKLGGAPISKPEETTVVDKRKKEKEEQKKEPQRILLTWLSEEPQYYKKVEDVLTPQSFTDPLYQKVAELLFEQIKLGEVYPAKIMDHFTQESEDYKEVSKVFHAKLVVEDQDRDKAFTNQVRRVLVESLDAQIAQVTDIKDLVLLQQKRQKMANFKLS